jgi:hypothetical protein
MEPEGSLPCSQEPSTGSYPEPNQSSPYHPNLSILILSTHLRLGLPSGLFPSGFPINILYEFIFPYLTEQWNAMSLKYAFSRSSLRAGVAQLLRKTSSGLDDQGTELRFPAAFKHLNQNFSW